nr:ribonuclease H-like domain, reverse transcriptase, RNA-dependent DNA polymerase [Tanacetum cinerariifolium]
MQNFISSSDILCWNIVLKGNSAKSMTTDKDGNLKIRPPVTAEEHQQARFGGNSESKKMQKSLLKQRVSVSASDIAATIVSPHFETEFAFMSLSTEAAQEKQDLMTKLDNEIANQAKWNNSGELGIGDSKFSIFYTNSDELEGQPIYNRFASVNHMKAVPPPLTGNYMPPSNIPDIDESQMVYGKKATDSSKIKTNDDSTSHSNDSVLFDFSNRSSEPSTNDFHTCDSSVEYT